MKKTAILILAALLLMLSPLQHTQAQIPIVGLITSAIKKVITALDIKVQQLQNQAIWLQNAQKNLENRLSLGELNNISGWLDKERNLYQGYYQELAKVRTLISDYDMVKTIISRQKQLVTSYQSAYGLLRQDPHFSAQEINYMGNVYNGLLAESARNLDEVLLAVNSFSTQMSDADRLQMIRHASIGIQKNLDDLRRFNSSNMALSLNRAKDEQDRQAVKSLYGIR